MTRPVTLISVFIIALLVIAYMIFQNSEMQSRIDDLEATTQQLHQQADDLSSHLDSTSEVINQKDSLLAACEERANLLLDEWDVNSLKRQGLGNPVEDLKEDLIASKELIQDEGVLGGEMQFYSKENIFILNHEWVLAYYEDGHNAGAMLLEYRVGQGGAIDWDVISSSLR